MVTPSVANWMNISKEITALRSELSSVKGHCSSQEFKARLLEQREQNMLFQIDRV
jgi:hypothetical protein